MARARGRPRPAAARRRAPDRSESRDSRTPRCSARRKCPCPGSADAPADSLRRVRMLIAEIALDANHSLVSGMAVETVHDSESAPLRHETETRIEHAKDDAVFERLMKVALRPQLGA